MAICMKGRHIRLIYYMETEIPPTVLNIVLVLLEAEQGLICDYNSRHSIISFFTLCGMISYGLQFVLQYTCIYYVLFYYNINLL